MSYDTTVVELVHPEPQPALPDAIARREANLDMLFPAIRKETLAFVVLMCVVFLSVSLYPLHHTDLWGHMAIGRWMSESPTDASPLLVDDANDSINTAWLSQWTLYKWHAMTGIEGLQLAHVLLATLAVGLVVWATRRRGVSMAIAIAAGAGTYLISLPVMGVIRPQLFGFAAMPLVLMGIAELDARRKHPLVWLPLVMIVWANFHGSFVVGLAVLGCFAIGRTWEGSRKCADRLRTFRADHAGTAWLAVVLATAACCVHPEGSALLWRAVSFGTSSNLADISEWQPLTIKSLSGVLFFGSLLITAVLLRLSPRTIRLYEALLLIGLAIGTLMAIRMLAWWAIVWPWVVAPHVEAILHTRRTTDTNSATPMPLYTLMASGIVLLTLVWSPPTYALVVSQPRAETDVLTDETPIYLADEMARRGYSGRTFMPAEWADYVVFKTEGRITPLVHSHVHLVSSGVMRDYRAIMSGHADWLKILDHHNTRYFVIRDLHKYTLARQVLDHPRVRTRYVDQQGAVLEILPLIAENSAPTMTNDVKQVKQRPVAPGETVQAPERRVEDADDTVSENQSM